MSALQRLNTGLADTVLGQPEVVEQVMVAFLARGHVLLEGVPGVAKTLTARAMAAGLGLHFTRVQFTPDLMPSDVLGTSVFKPTEGTFSLVKGPIFTDVLVADEINRTPPKTQAALLEAMEERQVSIDGTTHPLAPHFFVVATQNPLELEGTYPLPEAQLDRFLMRVRVGYPALPAEREMLGRFHQRAGQPAPVTAILSLAEVNELQREAGTIRCDDTVLDYVLALIRATRQEPQLQLGASPRAAQAVLAAAKARAALHQRAFTTPDDVKAVIAPVLNHRLVLKAEAEVEGATIDTVLTSLLARVEVKR